VDPLRIPIPALCVVVLVAAVVFWKWSVARVIVQTQRVEVPVEKVVTVYEDRIIRVPAPARANEKLHPVADLNPRIIGSSSLEN
jgi:hypothetical protein